MPGSSPGRGILFTTSRAPSPRTRSLTKDLAAVIPGGFRVTRGHLTMEELAAIARIRGADRVTIIGERRGNPSILRVYEAARPPLRPSLRNIVTLIIRGVALSRERGARPLRGGALYVEVAEGVEEYGEALIRAWHARLAANTQPRVRAVIKPDTGGAIIDFQTRDGRPAGPRLRVAKPRVMIKD
ncbi:MAG: hypothetical protein GSR80_000671 [Desulfurococcales archaeon]|nr:hypothetical protein [Desulfurococcales archaeon]